MMKKKNYIFIAILIAAILCLGIYGIYSKKFRGFENGSNNSSTVISKDSIKLKPRKPVIKREVPPGFKEFKTDRFHFSILYPDDLVLKEIGEGGYGATFTFTHPKGKSGFQIFVVPYSEPQVSEEQFEKDIPSGVRTDVKDIAVDVSAKGGGALGASFYSVDSSLGDTFEIWFVKDGFLYEVTTVREFESWLNEVMKSWKFI